MSDDIDENENTSTETEAEDPWAGALEEQADAEAGAIDVDAVVAEGAAPATDVQAAPLDNLQDDSTDTGDEVNLDVILDIPVTIAMEIGRTTISIRNLLQLNQGSVVELDRLAGEPMDVLVNGTLVAHGEVVVVNEKFGIRLTDVISATERLKKLR
ncbi:MAG: flagellar motor switch protein FliN [Sulfuriflexus sp.]|nr:flagellar motor switch protein FliN [Sulfuriflexus sp.]